MISKRETLRAWLRDAHAMETATIDNLQRQLDRVQAYPELHAKFDENLTQSRNQLRRIEECLDRLGADPSFIKDTATRLTGIAEVWLAGMSSDEVVKTCLAAYAYKQFEIASYTALAAAAEECGEQEVRRICQEILEEDQAMADWLCQHLPEITRQYLQQQAAARGDGRIARAGTMLREHPIPAALAAAGLGFVIAAGSRGAFRRSVRHEPAEPSHGMTTGSSAQK